MNLKKEKNFYLIVKMKKMNQYTLVKENQNKKFSVFENGIRSKTNLFYSKEDFEKELKFLELTGEVRVLKKDQFIKGLNN